MATTVTKDRFAERLLKLRGKVKEHGVFDAAMGVELIDTLLATADAEPVPPATPNPPTENTGDDLTKPPTTGGDGSGQTQQPS